MARHHVRIVGLSIGVAADQVGMHPQTLREYERQGLVEPQRTSGGARRYGPDELQRLLHVQRLTNEGISLAGVKYVLDLEDRLRAAHVRIRELERGIDARRGPRTELVRRSMSLEVVHVPKPPRSPRWRQRMQGD